MYFLHKWSIKHDMIIAFTHCGKLINLNKKGIGNL